MHLFQLFLINHSINLAQYHSREVRNFLISPVLTSLSPKCFSSTYLNPSQLPHGLVDFIDHTMSALHKVYSRSGDVILSADLEIEALSALSIRNKRETGQRNKQIDQFRITFISNVTWQRSYREGRRDAIAGLSGMRQMYLMRFHDCFNEAWAQLKSQQPVVLR